MLYVEFEQCSCLPGVNLKWEKMESENSWWLFWRGFWLLGYQWGKPHGADSAASQKEHILYLRVTLGDGQDSDLPVGGKAAVARVKGLEKHFAGYLFNLSYLLQTNVLLRKTSTSEPEMQMKKSEKRKEKVHTRQALKVLILCFFPCRWISWPASSLLCLLLSGSAST